MPDFDRRLRKLDEIETPDLWERAEAGSHRPQSDPPRLDPSPGRKLVIIGVAFALFAASGVFLLDRFSTEDEDPTDALSPSVTSSAIDPLRITCEEGDVAKADTNQAVLHPDGVHFEIDNPGHSDLIWIRNLQDTQRSFGIGGPEGTAFEASRPIPPGDWVAACFSGTEFTIGDIPASAFTAGFTVTDPDGNWASIQAAGRCDPELPPLAPGAGTDRSMDDLSGVLTVHATDPPSIHEQVFRVDADGSNPTTLDLPAAVVEVWGAELSPDGSRWVLNIPDDADGDPHVTNARTEDGEVWIADADGSNLTKVTDNDSEEYLVGWTPDGSRITFRSNRQTERDRHNTLYTMAPDGSDVRPLLPPGWEADTYAWSPDGSTIAFVGSSGSRGDACRINNEIYLAPADGSTDPVALTDSATLEQDPMWSPDGSKIAYRVSAGSSFTDSDIAVMDADGSDPVRLTDTGGYNAHPIWSPDGRMIAFTSDRRLTSADRSDRTDAPWVMFADGSGQQPLPAPTEGGLYDGWALLATEWEA